MTTRCLYQCAVVTLILAFCAFGQLALAQETHHFQVSAVERAQSNNPDVNPPPPANLYGLSAVFAATPFASGPNSDGSDRWPCFGSNSGNPDCPTIGNPSITFPAGGAALGIPNYVWPFTACDANMPQPTYTPCGQTNTWYEDDTNDTADDLIYVLIATQVQAGLTQRIVDSGIVDFAGPNPFGSTPGVSVVVYGDQNFGTLGQTGKNNGNCSANFQYPVAHNPPQPTDYPYVVADNKTCVNPLPGLATLTATTELAHPTYTQITKGCPNGETVCYTVKFTSKYKLTQKWNIWFK